MTTTPEPTDSRALVERLEEDLVNVGEAADAGGPTDVPADDVPADDVPADDVPNEAEPPD